MKKLLLVLCLLATGCNSNDWNLNYGGPHLDRFSDPRTTQYPQCRLPIALRQHNWLGSQGEGSCVHASFIMDLRNQGRFKTADWWKKNNGNGEWPEDMVRKMERANIRYAYTSGKGDARFLEWACSTHRGCGVTVMGGRHMVYLCHFDNKWAGIIDNNFPDVIKWVPRKTFLAEWRNSESWAVTAVYTPAPPRVPKSKS